MKHILIIITCLALAGCYEEEEPCNTKYSHDDTVGETGLRLTATSEPFIPFSKMEALYNEIQSCLNLTAPAPLVEYHNFKERGIGGGWGVFIVPSQTIWMNTDVGIAPRNCHSDRETLKHEYVHHLLYMNGGNYSHGSPEFERCGALGVATCNGIPCATGSWEK